LDSRYLWHWLTHIGPVLASKAKGATFKQVNKNDIGELPITLPPLPEQRRIAAILDQADALRTKRRQALAQLGSLTQSIFIEMFGNISISPKFSLSSIRAFADTNSGKSSKSVLSEGRTGIPIYGGNGINGWAHTALYDQPVLIFGRVGQHCGNAFITEGPSWVTDNAIVVRISDKTKLNFQFVLHAFQESGFSNRVKHLDLPFINQSMILDNPIPIPPLKVQQAFAERVQAVDALKANHRASLVELDNLCASLQHRAFRGEL
jgi:type I restriction enzyme S subunit